jgi:hypothetical protein
MKSSIEPKRAPQIRASSSSRWNTVGSHIIKSAGTSLRRDEKFTVTADEDRAAREKVASYLAEKPEENEHALAVEGLRYLRSVRELGLG